MAETVADFTTIQDAINKANVGDSIHVPAGVYFERLDVNKTVSLVGEDKYTTVIDGSRGGTVVQITADNVSISGFKIQNSGWGWIKNGIYVHMADNCEISNNYFFFNCHNIRLNYSRRSRIVGNTIDSNGYGIRLVNSEDCAAIGNSVSGCIGGVHLENATRCVIERNYFTQNGQGVRMYSPCTYNNISKNVVYNNSYDGMIETMPGNMTFHSNVIFHNSFINNTFPFIHHASAILWDIGYPFGGNYWSRYNGTDLYSGEFQNETGNDGIGDTEHPVNTYDSDRYPLIHPYGSVCNLDTNLTYLTIQAAIDAAETLEGHQVLVKSGIYREHISVNKTVSLVGENQVDTIIDGGNEGTVVIISAQNVSFTGFTVRNSGLDFLSYGMGSGIFLDHTSQTRIKNCLVTKNLNGIYLFHSEASTIENNHVHSNYENGLWLWHSGNNSLNNNDIHSNSYNFGVFGGEFSDFNNTIDSNNTVNGKPVYYVIGAEDEVFDDELDMGALYLINCNNITVQNLNFMRNGHGLFCYQVTDSLIANVTASTNNYGIYLQNSTGNIIQNSTCLDSWVGISLQDSALNLVEDSVTSKGEKGFSLYNADDNIIKGNSITYNLFGIRLYSSHNNTFFQNNLIENTEQASLIISYQNLWDNGFAGNYWSNYNGSDNDPPDGTGSSPQLIDSNNRDNRPLLGIFYKFTVHHEGTVFTVTIISNSTITKLSYENHNNTIRLTVNGTNGTLGFCRIRIPNDLVQPEISVIIDEGTTEVLYINNNIQNETSQSSVYFVYRHPTYDILILPEFSTVLLTILMFVSLSLLLSIKKGISIAE